MPGIARKNIDNAGGIIIETPITSVYAEGYLVAGLGSNIQSHGSGIHSSAILNEASSTVFAEGIAISRAGDRANCLHATTGSSSVFVGD